MFFFCTSVYLFAPGEGSCYFVSTRNNCFEFLTSEDDNLQSLSLREDETGRMYLEFQLKYDKLKSFFK